MEHTDIYFIGKYCINILQQANIVTLFSLFLHEKRAISSVFELAVTLSYSLQKFPNFFLIIRTQ